MLLADFPISSNIPTGLSRDSRPGLVGKLLLFLLLLEGALPVNCDLRILGEKSRVS